MILYLTLEFFCKELLLINYLVILRYSLFRKSRQMLFSPLLYLLLWKKKWDFPCGTVVKNPPANAGARIRSLVREDPICCRAAKPMSHNY